VNDARKISKDSIGSQDTTCGTSSPSTSISNGGMALNDFVLVGMQRSKERPMQRQTSPASLVSSRSSSRSLSSLESRTGAKTSRGISLDRLEQPRLEQPPQDTSCGMGSPSTNSSDVFDRLAGA